MSVLSLYMYEYPKCITFLPDDRAAELRSVDRAIPYVFGGSIYEANFHEWILTRSVELQPKEEKRFVEAINYSQSLDKFWPVFVSILSEADRR